MASLGHCGITSGGLTLGKNAVRRVGRGVAFDIKGRLGCYGDDWRAAGNQKLRCVNVLL